MAEVVRIGDRTIEGVNWGARFSIGKPPWSSVPHTGRAERLILQLGAGKGKFSETQGIPRSIGCIGNNRFVLRRAKLSRDEIERILLDFKRMKGEELWLTNYDDVDELLWAAKRAVEIGFERVNAVVLEEDLEKVKAFPGVRFIAELEYSREDVVRTVGIEWVSGILVMVNQENLNDAMEFLPRVGGDVEVYIDVLYPKSARFLSFNVIELRRIMNPTVEKYNDCLAGTIAVSGDGYVTPCPLLRNYVVQDARENGLKGVLRKKRLKSFWTLTKDKIETCSGCPFRYVCHDCRALEYQATGEIEGIEYCPIAD